MSIAAFLLAMIAAAPSQDRRESTVGMPARVEEIVLPGSELETTAADAKSPIVLRVAAASPHGTAFRYDLEYWGLEPGEFDLARFLRRKDGTATSDLPPIAVTIRSVLPAGQVKPHAPVAGALPSLGGYRTLLVAGGAVWLAGLAWLVWGGRKRKRAEIERVRPRTLAERLRPLVEAALEGRLSRSERAQLELSLVAYWRRRLSLENRRPEETLGVLRQHAEAGPLLRGLEDWLHRPAPRDDVDVAALLAPYRDLPAEALETLDAARA